MPEESRIRLSHLIDGYLQFFQIRLAKKQNIIKGFSMKFIFQLLVKNRRED